MPGASRPSERGAAAALLAGLLLLAGAAAVPRGAARTQEAERLEGEYGLWVETDGRELDVHWITAREDSGFLRAVVGRRVRADVRTPPGRAHHQRLRLAGRGSVTLEYGAVGDPLDRHSTTLEPAPPERAPVAVSRVDSLFVVGDVHGAYDRLLRLLRNAGLVDAGGRWSGGRRHLVFAGDLLDRGADATRTLWYVYGLERQAARAGGGVHVVLGNHEIMVMTDDLRYVAPKERRIAALHGVGYARLFHPRRSVLGRWLASRPALMRFDRVLVAHGGVTPDQLGYSLQSFDDSLAAYVGEELFLRWSDTTYAAPLDSAAFQRRYRFFWEAGSVFWHRGYVHTDTLQDELARVLDRFRGRILVVGHTQVPTLQPRYGGALIAAHPAAAAQEMLLLVRRGDEYERYRFRLEGPPERF